MDIAGILKKAKNLSIYFPKENDSHEDAVLEKVFDDKLLISCSNDFNFEKAKGVLAVDIYSSGGILSGSVTIIKKQDNQLYLSFPFNTHLTQRREYIRVPEHLDLTLFVTSGEEEKLYNLKSKDISGKGIAFISDFEIDSSDKLKIFFKINQKDFCLDCEKVYSKTVMFNDKEMYLHALTFTNISKEEIAIIVRECLDFQIKTSKKEEVY